MKKKKLWSIKQFEILTFNILIFIIWHIWIELFIRKLYDNLTFKILYLSYKTLNIYAINDYSFDNRNFLIDQIKPYFY